MKRILVSFCFALLLPTVGYTQVLAEGPGFAAILAADGPAMVGGILLAQGQAPNRRDIVEQVSAADPARFACAHTGRPCEADWIKAVAAALHATDARWGLNGKRGNPNDLSLDVVTFRIGPTDRHVQAFDICGACGGGSPQVVWNDITNWQTIGQAGTAVWVRPAGVVDPEPQPPTPSPQPAPQPAPAPPVDLSPLMAKLDAILAEIAVLKANHDGIAAVATEARDKAADAANESLNAAARALQILDGLALKPCFAGSQSGWAGGKIRLCPE